MTDKEAAHIMWSIITVAFLFVSCVMLAGCSGQRLHPVDSWCSTDKSLCKK